MDRSIAQRPGRDKRRGRGLGCTLTTDAWIALGILTLALLFVTEWLRVDVVALDLVAAQKLAIQPYALMAVVIATSMTFASPVNTPLMGAGNCRLADDAQVGVPLLLVAPIVSFLLLPLLGPLWGMIP